MADHGEFGTSDAAAVTVWDRYLAQAVALDLAPVVVAQLPLGAEDDRHAWSRATGEWRKVVVRYPRVRPGEGRHPLAVALVGLVVVGGAVVVLRLLAEVSSFDEPVPRWVDGVMLVSTVGAVVVVVLAAVASIRGVADLFASSVREGLLLRARRRETGDRWPGPLRLFRPESDDRRRLYYLAVDEGTSYTVRAWRVRPAVHASVSQGTRVRAVVTPRLHYVRSIERALS
jgi:hypothetical protein